MNPKIEASSLVDSSAVIGQGTRVWHNSQVRDGVAIGDNCIIGRNVYIGSGVRIGQNCKIQNNALIYEPTVIADGVFIGPGVILTNDQYPRAANPDLTLKSADDWIFYWRRLNMCRPCFHRRMVNDRRWICCHQKCTKFRLGCRRPRPTNRVGWEARL